MKNITETTIIIEDGKTWLWHKPQAEKGGTKPRIDVTGTSEGFISWLITECNLHFPYGINKTKGDTTTIKGWRERHTDKKGNSKRNNTNYEISFLEYLTLAYQANITLTDIGSKGDSSKNYQLCRKDHDEGYTFDNCEFDTQENNMNERMERCGSNWCTHISKIGQDSYRVGCIRKWDYKAFFYKAILWTSETESIYKYGISSSKSVMNRYIRNYNRGEVVRVDVISEEFITLREAIIREYDFGQANKHLKFKSELYPSECLSHIDGDIIYSITTQDFEYLNEELKAEEHEDI